MKKIKMLVLVSLITVIGAVTVRAIPDSCLGNLRHPAALYTCLMDIAIEYMYGPASNDEGPPADADGLSG